LDVIQTETYHWHLGVTFREDANRTIDKDAAYNLNIIRKVAINVLKLLDMGIKNISLRGKRFVMGLDPEFFLERLMAL